MSEHEFYDSDIGATISYDDDTMEMVFTSEEVGAINLNKDDVAYLAKCFGLVVYEKDSAL